MKKTIFLTVLIFLFSILNSFGQDSLKSSTSDSLKIIQLENKIRAIEEKLEESELQNLLNEAENQASEDKEQKSNKVFKSGQRALQALNPEISVIGEGYGQIVANSDGFTEGDRTGFYLRTLDLHIQSSLDPFSVTKAIIEFSHEGVEIGEVYLTWSNFLPKISLTAGKFRQHFGVVNRWHAHALDQFDYPLAISEIFGEEGLNQMGLSFNWLMPSVIADANELTLEITNGENEKLFSGENFSLPSVLLHFKNYFDLSPSTYIEFGLTGMFGKNNVKGFEDGIKIIEDNRNTILSGLDLTLFWKPVNKGLYKSLTWRSELFYVSKEMLNSSDLSALGGYSYLEYKFAKQWQIGSRFDFTQPFEENNDSRNMYQFTPYITWHQSEWVRLRLQYNYLNGNVFENASNTIRLQAVWAVGPHKHDRY